MGFVLRRNTLESLFIALARLGRVVFEEFFRHKGCGRLKLTSDRFQNLQNCWHIVDQGNIERFDFRPEWKAAIGNNQRIGMAYSGQERKQIRVEDLAGKHRYGYAETENNCKTPDIQAINGPVQLPKNWYSHPWKWHGICGLSNRV